MASRLITAFITALVLAIVLPLPMMAQDYQRETDRLAEEIATAVTKAELRHVAVMDFTDLQGNVQEIGRFMAEELTTSLVLQNRAFKTIDRANLRSILDEQKLTMTGLVNPENARKLKISGVDGLIRGTLTPFGDGIRITVQIIAVETAQIVGAARGVVPKTSAMENLGGAIEDPAGSLSSGPRVPSRFSPSPQAKRGKYVFQDGTLRVTLRSFRKNSENKIAAIFLVEDLKDKDLNLVWRPEAVDDQGEQWRMFEISGIGYLSLWPTRVSPSAPLTVLVVFKLENGTSRGTKFNILGPIEVNDGRQSFSSSPSFHDVPLGFSP
ncbi:MAG TPA: FlgO family outer membrane protein [Thermoanaerobaculia bacterium]|nr:FlgO family outer membrane protein [Thermoanaerobaculia bacterium]